MRYTIPVIVALAASVSATAPLGSPDKLVTLELGPGETIEVTEEEKFKLLAEHSHFLDITDVKDIPLPSARLAAAAVRAYPGAVNQQEAVAQLIEKIDIELIKSQLTDYSTLFLTRFYRSDSGVQAAQWLYARVKEVIDESGSTTASIRYEYNTAFPQPSIVVSIKGSGDGPTVVLGAHLDSINQSNSSGAAPGADDDGSGTIMNLDVLRVLLTDPRIAAGDHLNTLEFHWYAAEEGGCLGSLGIFSQYSTNGVDVAAMLQQDMVGYTGRSGAERFGLITDYTNAAQNEFLKLVVDEYADIPYEESKCGYGCSDHSSANRYGYPSSFLFETPYGNHSPYIHQTGDTVARISFDHVYQHAKVATGFVYELAHHDFA